MFLLDCWTCIIIYSRRSLWIQAKKLFCPDSLLPPLSLSLSLCAVNMFQSELKPFPGPFRVSCSPFASVSDEIRPSVWEALTSAPGQGG